MSEEQAIKAGAKLYKDLDDMFISVSEFNAQMKLLHRCTNLTFENFDMRCYDLSFVQSFERLKTGFRLKALHSDSVQVTFKITVMKAIKLNNISDFCDSVNFAKHSNERYILLTNDTPCIIVSSNFHFSLKKYVNSNF